MTDVGDTLRSARERRGEPIATSAAALGVQVADLRRVEGAATPAPADAPLAARYAAHLEIDGPVAAAATVDHQDEDTQPIPVVPPARRRDPALVWIGAGAVGGVAALVVLGGGLGSGGGGRSPVPTVSSAPATAAAPQPQAQRPTPAASPETELALRARPGRTVWVEVRRGGVSGPSLFAGRVGGGVTRHFTSSRPLWLGVAWAPSVVVTVNGEELDLTGGTESYVVTARGLRRIARS